MKLLTIGAFAKRQQIALLIIASLACACDSSDKSPAADAMASADQPSGSLPSDPDDQNGIANDQGSELGLTPLPNPPLTAAPDSASEPVPAPDESHTIVDFSVVRDPYSTSELADNSHELTDEDFESGALPPVIITPDSVDPQSNQPPYFVDLQNVEAIAGEELLVRFKPRDPEGEVPGMFPGPRPDGAQFVDNFDGSKSLRWRPLQPDEGIHEFTVTAIDPEEPEYRTIRTIRIRVSVPDDESAIVNLPPGINLIRRTTARVNDPIVAHIKVTDPNGTIPSLEIVSAPPGATFVSHFSEPDFTIMQFTAQVAGEFEIELLARDAVDPDLITESSFFIDVQERDSFLRPGARLRELASERDLLFGYAAIRNFYEFPDGALYADIAGEEFNIVSSENAMKWDVLNPLPGKYRWAAADNLVQFAKSKEQTVHAHTLVWHRQLPQWILHSEPSERMLHMREFIDRVMNRYADDVQIWDVVNESLEEDGSFRNSVWYEAMGDSYIDTAFRQARQSAPDATLLYNDYDVAFAGPKSTAMINLLRTLKDQGTPIDGAGFQLHVFADFDKFDEVAETFQQIANLDLDIYITELDVSMQAEHSEQQQAQVYERLLSICLAQMRCKAFQMWGFTDMYSWRQDYQPLIFDESYQIKPAYTALQTRLSEN